MTGQRNTNTPQDNESVGAVILIIIGLFAAFVAICIKLEKIFPKG